MHSAGITPSTSSAFFRLSCNDSCSFKYLFIGIEALVVDITLRLVELRLVECAESCSKKLPSIVDKLDTNIVQQCMFVL